MNSCVFCKIVNGEIPADVVYDSENIMAFRDINPSAPTHVLVIPKRHFASLDALPSDDALLAGEILLAVKTVAEKIGVSGGYKVLTNCGEPAGQVVHHLHFHILAGKKFVP